MDMILILSIVGDIIIDIDIAINIAQRVKMIIPIDLYFFWNNKTRTFNLNITFYENNCSKIDRCEQFESKSV